MKLNQYIVLSFYVTFAYLLSFETFPMSKLFYGFVVRFCFLNQEPIAAEDCVCMKQTVRPEFHLLFVKLTDCSLIDSIQNRSIALLLKSIKLVNREISWLMSCTNRRCG